MKNLLILTFLTVVAGTACSANENEGKLMTGAERISEYLPLIQGKSVAIMANQTSTVAGTHLVDTLLSLGADIRLIFAPEHGFRDLADDGAVIVSGTDPVTGIHVMSLYGNKKKPAPEDLEGIDVVIYDIQDVGTRFYTYLTSMCYLMEACAGNDIPLIVMDRPNPNGFYVDGPILDTATHSSFVGIHPVPVVHGMTLGEYAGMVNGEGWLANRLQCDLTVINCAGYTHDTKYDLPVIPSPNLPNMNSVYLYPSICFSEGTVLSCGRGTTFAFQILGAPKMPDTGFSFTPQPGPGASNPKHNGVACYGIDLRNALAEGVVPMPEINLDWIIDAYMAYPEKESFFTGYFDTLAGSSTLREQIIQGMSAEEIKESWKEGLDAFRVTRSKYLLYN